MYTDQVPQVLSQLHLLGHLILQQIVLFNQHSVYCSQIPGH